MTEATRDLVITSVESDVDITLLSQKLGKALKRNVQEIEFALNEIASLAGSDFCLVNAMPESKANQLQGYLQKQGVGSELRDGISLEIMIEVPEYICPSCGHHQEQTNESDDTCKACGVIGSKYAGIQLRKEILESERRKHQALEQMNVDQLRKNSEAAEEERLREEARQKLGIRKKKKAPVFFATLLTFITAGVGGHYLQKAGYIPAFILSGEVNSEAATEGVIAAEGSAQQQPLLSIPPTGGNITLNMPEPASTASSTSTITVATEDNAPPMSDSESQNLALSMNQQTEIEEFATESQVKASLVAHGIDNPSMRKAVLEITGGEEVPTKPSTLAKLKEVGQEDFSKEDPLLQNLITIVDNQLAIGNVDKALQLVEKAQNQYQEAVLLHKVIESKLQDESQNSSVKAHIDQLAKLIWTEPDPINQVRIQSLLSTAYALSGEQKLASLNLVMAIEKLRFVESDAVDVELLLQLSKNQSAVGNVSQAREILSLVEDKANDIPKINQEDIYAQITQQYAQSLDFNQAMKLTEKIQNPALLKETLGIITEIQGS